MKHLFALAAILGLAGGTALAAEPTPIGDWLVKDGYANIRIDNCGGKMWGIVAWEKTPGGVDSENPDPAKKSRPDPRHADPDRHGADRSRTSGRARSTTRRTARCTPPASAWRMRTRSTSRAACMAAVPDAELDAGQDPAAERAAAAAGQGRSTPPAKQAAAKKGAARRASRRRRATSACGLPTSRAPKQRRQEVAAANDVEPRTRRYGSGSLHRRELARLAHQHRLEQHGRRERA